MKYFVYYLYSDSLQKYYIGKTNDLARRFKEHNNSEEIYTKKGTPWVLIGYLECDDSTTADKLERKLKKARNTKYVHWYIETNGTIVE